MRAYSPMADSGSSRISMPVIAALRKPVYARRRLGFTAFFVALFVAFFVTLLATLRIRLREADCSFFRNSTMRASGYPAIANSIGVMSRPLMDDLRARKSARDTFSPARRFA